MQDLKTNQKFIMPDTFSGELKALLWLGLPMAAAQFIQFSIYFVDTVMLGRIGPEALAAAGLGSVIYFLLWMIGCGPVMAVTPLVSQALGADSEDRRDARKTVRMALWVVFMMTPFALALLLVIEPLIALVKPELAQPAAHYMMALIAGWPFALGVWALRNFLAAIEKTRVPLLLVSITVLINAGLNALLIFGLWGFPRLELIGAGIASSISYTLCFCMFVAYCYWDKDAREFQLGWPISITTIFEGMLFNACVFLMALIGTNEVAAYQVALNAAAMAFMLPFGFAMAGSVRVGLAKGAQNAAAVRRVGLATTAVCIVLIMMFAALITLAPEWVANLYLSASSDNNQVVRGLVLSFLPIAAAFMLFDATQVAANQLLRGLKDVKVPMWITGLSYWVVGFPIAWYLGLKTEIGAPGVWYGLLAGLAVASVLLGARFYWLAWRRHDTAELTPKVSPY